MTPPDWHFECDTAIFERIKTEKSFQQILALARAVNGLQFVISALVNDAILGSGPTIDSPGAQEQACRMF
jgi:hypothetical protein